MGDYNKPITARIQHSTSKGMKIQEPLLDIGSVVHANAALIQGEKAAAGRTPDSAGAFKAGMDSKKSESSDTETTPTTPNPAETDNAETDNAESPGSPAPFNPALRQAKKDGKLPPDFASIVKRTNYGKM
jgi:hypothetical protein